MRAIAVIEATRPGIDAVIVWEHEGRLIAYGYEEGKVSMTRPLGANNLEDGITEVQQNFQITEGQLHRVTNWQDNTITAEPVPTSRTRW